VPLPSGVRTFGEALAAVNAMFRYPLAQGTPEYEEWRAGIAELPEFARKCPETASCSLSHHGPINRPDGILVNGPMQHALAPDPQQPAQPAAGAPEHVSVGSSSSCLPRNARDIINERQIMDARVCIKCRCHR
jgi:hypothetical protein